MTVGLDTNVLVRYLLEDDKQQASVAQQHIQQAVAEGHPVLISLITLLETEWVLRSYGQCDKATVIQIFQTLLELRDVEIEQEESLEQALHYYKNSKADFADCLMLSRYQRSGCSAMLTFDKTASSLPGCKLLEMGILQ